MEIKKFGQIKLTDPFFNSLKADYDDFEAWFKRKSNENATAFVQYNDDGDLSAFLYLKIETTTITDVNPILPAARRLKVGTFKVNAHGTKVGEYFIKKIMDKAITEDVDSIYVTIFDKDPQKPLIDLLKKFGFKFWGYKNQEHVLLKDMRSLTGDLLLDYPLIKTVGKRKFLLSIYPAFHTRMFPDSILKNEESQRYDLVTDVSQTNSIHKTYICFMSGVSDLRRGDLIAIYRTNDFKGPARYRSVITSICQIEEVRTRDSFPSLKEFVEYSNPYSVFDINDLSKWYHKKGNVTVLKMTYNIALKKRVTRGYLLDNLNFSSDIYWGFFQLSDAQFRGILKEGEAPLNVIIND